MIVTLPYQSERTTWRKSALPLAGPRRRGVVLIVVLVLVVMVALAGFGFLAAMSTEYEAARLNGSMLQARQTMASAESSLIWLAGLSERERRMMGGLTHNPALFRSRVVEPLSVAGSGDRTSTVPLTTPPEQPLPDSETADDRWRFSIVSLDSTPEQTRILRFGVQNESDKLHLATLLRWEQASPGDGRAALMHLPGMTEAQADAILDWIDPDDQPREFGAEAEYYQTLDQPYRPSNAVPQTLTELLYVKGVTRRQLMGIPIDDPLTANDQTSQAAEQLGAARDGIPAADPHLASRGWNHFLTVYSAERNSNRAGQPRVFLNAGSLATLEQQLSVALPENLVRYILLARVYGISPSAGSGEEPDAAPFSLSMVPAFSMTSLADLINSVIVVPGASATIVVQSPLQTDQPDFAEMFAALLDQATTHSAPVIPGRINLRTASETVLRMIPGLTPELVSQITTQRDSLDVGQEDSAAWLLSGNILDPSTFRRLFPEITMGGDVFQSEIIVHRAIGGPLLRRNLILDAASSPVRRVHWTDLTDAPMSFSHRMLLSPEL